MIGSSPDGTARAVSVLVVEDDPDIADTLAESLEDHGFQVATAANGRDALHHLRRASVLPDVILLDLMMPVMDGWEFRTAQTSDPALAAVPVVLLSAHVNVSDAAAKLATAAWLRKPVELKALVKTLLSVKDGAR